VLLAAGMVFPTRRVTLLLAGGALAVAVAAVLSLADWVRQALVGLISHAAEATMFGSGECALGHLSAADSGLAVLAGMVGWFGAAWFVGVLAICILWLLFHARRGRHGDRGRAVVWSISAGCTAAALIAPGGLFIPATALAASLVLGLLPAMLGRPGPRRPGVVLLAAVAAMLVLLGLAPDDGLFRWSLGQVGRSDSMLHLAVGLLTAMLLAWQMGSRRVWLGLLAIVLAGMLGGAAEVMQLIFSERTAELRDWRHHAMGAAAAVGPYLLVMLARWCESPDARNHGTSLAYGPYSM